MHDASPRVDDFDRPVLVFQEQIGLFGDHFLDKLGPFEGDQLIVLQFDAVGVDDALDAPHDIKEIPWHYRTAFARHGIVS